MPKGARALSQLNDSPGILLRRHKVKVTQFRHRMATRVVIRALCQLTPWMRAIGILNGRAATAAACISKRSPRTPEVRPRSLINAGEIDGIDSHRDADGFCYPTRGASPPVRECRIHRHGSSPPSSRTLSTCASRQRSAAARARDRAESHSAPADRFRNRNARISWAEATLFSPTRRVESPTFPWSLHSGVFSHCVQHSTP